MYIIILPRRRECLILDIIYLKGCWCVFVHLNVIRIFFSNRINNECAVI